VEHLYSLNDEIRNRRKEAMAQEGFYENMLRGTRGAMLFCASVAATGVFSYLGERNSLWLAMISTLAVAGASKLFSHPLPFEEDQNPIRNGPQYLAEGFFAALGLSLITGVLPPTRNFLCDPLVPWTISIAIFGAFSFAWLSTASAIQVPSKPISLMILLAFFWIAPFYGFFHGPWFLAQTIIAPCADRSWAAGIVVAASMMVASLGGRWTAQHLFPDSR
jgi:hypothetical protein